VRSTLRFGLDAANAEVLDLDARVSEQGTLPPEVEAALSGASRIHRTDLPGRCLFAATYSTSFATLEYLDELPFPVAELPHRRAAVCDYCFFGGPTGTEVLVGSTRA
jgi:hypothetical protein